MVPGMGPLDAEIMIVMGPPGVQEQIALKPLAGNKTSWVLEECLDGAGIELDDCYITNIAKHRLPSKRTSKKLLKAELEACRPYLEFEIARVRPKVIIALGGPSIGWFTGNGNVSAQRGRAITLEDGSILMPTFSPGSFQRSGADTTVFVGDLGSAKRIADGAADITPTDYKIVTTLDELGDFVVEVDETREFAWDIETSSLCPFCGEITDIIVCAKPGTAYVIPLLEWRIQDFVHVCDSEVVEFVAGLIRNPDILSITHGGTFDNKYMIAKQFLTLADIVKKENVADTLYMYHSLLNEHPPHNLKYRAGVETDMPSWDAHVHDKGLLYQMPLEERAAYAGGDADATLRLYHVYMERLEQQGYNTDFYYDVVNPMLPCLVDIMLNGFKVDADQMWDVRQMYKAQLRHAESRLLEILKIDPTSEKVHEMCGVPAPPRKKDQRLFNPGSDPQMIKAIEWKLKFKWPRDRYWFLTDKKEPSARKEVRTAMKDLFPHEFWNVWADHRGLIKLLGQYVTSEDTLYATHGESTRPRSIPAKMCPLTDRVHTSILPHGTRTGRRSSKDPNLQNPPKRDDEGSLIQKSLVRTLFVPSEADRLLVACDFDTAEVWVAAHLSVDPELLRVFDENLDFHGMTAARIFGYEYEQFMELVDAGKANKKAGKKVSTEMELVDNQRTKAKVVNFGGILYGGGARKISRDIDVSEQEAAHLLDEVAKVYQRFYEWRDEQVELIKERGYVETAYGGRRHLKWPEGTDKAILREQGHIAREAFNSPIQGTVAHHMAKVMPRVLETLTNGFEGAILLEMHDELISEIQEAQADDWLAAKLDAMTLVIPAFGKALPVSGEIRKRWKNI